MVKVEIIKTDDLAVQLYRWELDGSDSEIEPAHGRAGSWKSVQVIGTFEENVVINGSLDNTSWEMILTFNAPGIKKLDTSTYWYRPLLTGKGKVTVLLYVENLK